MERVAPDLQEFFEATINVKDDDAIASNACEDSNGLKIRVLLGRKCNIGWPKLVTKAGF